MALYCAGANLDLYSSPALTKGQRVVLVKLLPILPISNIKGTLDCFCKEKISIWLPDYTVGYTDNGLIISHLVKDKF